MPNKTRLNKAHFSQKHYLPASIHTEKPLKERVVLLSLLPWPAIIALLTSYWPQILAGIILAFAARILILKMFARLWRGRVAHVAEILNGRLDNSCVFYSANGFVGRVVGVSPTSDNSLAVDLLRLDYHNDRPLHTASTSYQGRPDSLGVKGILRRRGAIYFPPDIVIGSNKLSLLREGSEYHFLVYQHHHAWKLLQRLQDYRERIKSDILRIDIKSAKYLHQTHIPDAAQRLELARQDMIGQFKQIESASVDIGRIIEGLTIRIESIEDFGGLLVGSERRLIEAEPSSHGREESVDLALAQQDCEEISLILRSYEKLLSSS